MMNWLAKRVYYGVQRLRGGVTPLMVRQAEDLLDRPWTDVRNYVDRRLRTNYNVQSSGGIEWLHEQAITRTEDYRMEAQEISARGGWWGPQVRRTSGSSGSPFSFRRDRDMLGWMDAAMWAVYGWYGISPGDRMARFWGRPLSTLEAAKRRVVDAVLRQRRMNAFQVSRKRSLTFFDELLSWKPRYIYGYPTLIREFAEAVRGSGVDGRELELRVVITTGELLDASTRGLLGDFFGCPIANEYGCSESGILSFECPEGSPHLVPVAAYPEVLIESRIDRETREGEVLVTDLYGDTMPFVRYALDDVGRLQPPEPCECGCELPQLDIVSGRVDSFICTPEGQKIYDAVLAYTVPEGVAQFRVRQTNLGRLEGEVVVAPGSDEGKVINECQRRWSQAVGSKIDVEVTAVDRIVRPRTGKRRYFVPLNDDGNSDSATSGG